MGGRPRAARYEAKGMSYSVERAPLTATQRVRRYRQRLADGLMLVSFEVDACKLVDTLQRAGVLRREDSDDPRAISAAVTGLIEAMSELP